MNGCDVQGAQQQSPRPFQVPGTITANVLAFAKNLGFVLSGSVKWLLVRREQRHLVLVPVPAIVPHRIRPRTSSGFHSFGG